MEERENFIVLSIVAIVAIAGIVGVGNPTSNPSDQTQQDIAGLGSGTASVCPNPASGKASSEKVTVALPAVIGSLDTYAYITVGKIVMAKLESIKTGVIDEATESAKYECKKNPGCQPSGRIVKSASKCLVQTPSGKIIELGELKFTAVEGTRLRCVFKVEEQQTLYEKIRSGTLAKYSISGNLEVTVPLPCEMAS